MSGAARERGGRMSFDEYLVWSERQEGRHELVDGFALKMASETAGHVRVKLRAADALREAIGRAGVPCEAFGDGMTVRIDERHGYEPDALVHCGEPIDDDAREAPSPVIVVEVVSPTSGTRDTNAKLLGYCRVPGLRHYMVVVPNECRIVHYRLGGDETDPTTRSTTIRERSPTIGRPAAPGRGSGDSRSPRARCPPPATARRVLRPAEAPVTRAGHRREGPQPCSG